jgi:hypothetical protein
MYIPLIIKNIYFTLSQAKLISYKSNFPECIVIGSGPSFNETIKNHKYFFTGKSKLCVNGFASTRYFSLLRPDYYLLIDPVYWSTNMSMQVEEHCQKIFNLINTQVKWPMVIFLPLPAEGQSPFERLSALNKNIKIHYFALTEISGPEYYKNFMYRHNFATPTVQNVLVGGIFLCLNMGFKKIYLIGADHSWHENIYIDENNKLWFRDVHFFGKKNPKRILLYKDAQESDKHIFNISDFFTALSRMFKGYNELENYSKTTGAKVYNASAKSYIDAFERFKIPSQKNETD